MDDATEVLPLAAERVEDENGEFIVLGNVAATADADSNSVAVAATVEEVELPPPRLMITKMVRKPLATIAVDEFSMVYERLNLNNCPPPHLFRFDTGTRKLQIIRRSKDHRPFPQMLLLRGWSQWIRQIQCHRRHVIRLWEACQETTSQ